MSPQEAITEAAKIYDNLSGSKSMCLNPDTDSQRIIAIIAIARFLKENDIFIKIKDPLSADEIKETAKAITKELKKLRF